MPIEKFPSTTDTDIFSRKRIQARKEFWKGVSGDEYERAILGICDVENPKYQEALEKIKKPSKNPAFNYYVKFDDALKLARKFQPLIDKENPEKGRAELHNPQSHFLKELRLALVEFLDADDDDERIRVYTTVGTPLDYLNGTDAIIDIDGKIITVDIKKFVGEYKKSTSKADIVLNDPFPNPKNTEDEIEMDAFVAIAELTANKACGLLDKRTKEKIKIAA